MARKIDTSAKAAALLASVDAFVFDMDGVLWHGTELIPHVRETLAMLKAKGKRLIFATNNSTKSRANYYQKMLKLGLDVEQDCIVGSAYTVAYYLKHVHKLPIDAQVFVLGERGGIHDELEAEGIRHVGNDPEDIRPFNPETADLVELDEAVRAVVVGFDGHLTYAKLVRTQQYLLDPTRVFLATNTDATYPLRGRLLPGTGAIVQAVATSAGRPPIVCGKPSDTMLQCVMEKFGLDGSRTCMVGDRLDTDIALGRRGGMRTLLVLSGVTTLSQLEAQDANGPSDHQPEFFMESLGGLSQLLEQ